MTARKRAQTKSRVGSQRRHARAACCIPVGVIANRIEPASDHHKVDDTIVVMGLGAHQVARGREEMLRSREATGSER